MDCPDCRSGRRDFLRTAAAASLAIAADAAPRVVSSSETLVSTFYNSLTEEQKKTVCMPFDHPLRSKVDNNWFITGARIAKFFTPDQQQMVREIFQGLYAPEFVPKVMHQLDEDAKGLGNYSVALFGTPSTGKFEFVLTGRHCTVRCDGDSVEGAAFGGPIFYGHQAGPNATEDPEHRGNVYWYQAVRANEVFQALNGKQREMALITEKPREEKATTTAALHKKSELVGLPVADMSRDQRALVEKVLADLLMPYRKKDVDEAMRYIKANGGVSALSMSFYKDQDLGNDGMWDIWQLESPTMLWYFRGAPHVHTWVNIRA